MLPAKLNDLLASVECEDLYEFLKLDPSSFTGSPAGNPRVGVKVLVRRADRKGA